MHTVELAPPTLTRVRAVLGLLAPELRFAALLLATTTVARLALSAWLASRVGSLGALSAIALGGLRMDIVLVSYAAAPSIVLALALGGLRPVDALRRGYLALVATLSAFLELATPAYLAEFDGRPDRLFLEYLGHPREVGAMLVRGYPIALALISVALFAAACAILRLLRAAPPQGPGVLARLAAAVVLAPALTLGARSSLQHRPANPSSVVFSQDHLLNDLCLSSLYSVAYAAASMQSEADAADVYGRLESDAAVVAEVRDAMETVPLDTFTSNEFPTLHRQTATTTRARPLNLVIVLEESLGAQYVGALGGRAMTPHFDTLADEGWWFEHMYATGTRSVRGIEAVVAGFPPTPARSVVKLGLSQHGFCTLASLLGSRGYHTQFVYGGESHFDNMKRFFSGNGFEEIIDRDDFVAPRFAGSWGVSDDDMFDALHAELAEERDAPLFTLAFTVSNHSPWEYPTDEFQPVGPPATVDNAVRYADHALGRFLARARASAYWDDTLFCVVADHDSRVYGASLVPLEHFHIPAVILGPDVPRRRDARVASQLDLAPTLLSLLGVSAEHPMIGHDLTALPLDAPGRALMQYDANQALLEGDRVVVLQPSLAPSHFTWDGARLAPAPRDAPRERRALAYALLPSRLYRERLYRCPSAEAVTGAWSAP